MIKNILLPSPCFLNTLVKLLSDEQVINCHECKIIFSVREKTYFCPSSIAFIATWGQFALKRGVCLEFVGDSRVLNYLSRANLFKYLEFNYIEKFERKVPMGRFIPLTRIESENDLESAYMHVCELIVCQFDNSREFLPAVDWSLYEVLDNVLAHSMSCGDSFLFGQYFEKKKKIIISVSDYGQGLVNSLGPKYEINSGADAIRFAIKRGVTSKEGDHLGNGLAGTKDICEINGGRFCVMSGGSFYVNAQKKEAYYDIACCPGTSVLMDLKTDRPVDLKDTFIEENEANYIYRIADVVDNGHDFFVVDECPDFGSRSTAKRFRRKIEAIVPDVDSSVILNFESVESISSSFADELIGKMFIDLGDSFFHKIGIRNMKDSVKRRIDAVIKQRASNRSLFIDDQFEDSEIN